MGEEGNAPEIRIAVLNGTGCSLFSLEGALVQEVFLLS